jgi:hypothetical protein
MRDKVTENLHITERALLPTLLNRLAAVRLKVQQEHLEEFLVKPVTRVVSVSGRVTRKARKKDLAPAPLPSVDAELTEGPKP